jgi:hypothetical protein
VLTELEKTFQIQPGDILYYIRTPQFDVVRSDPRYLDLMRRVNPNP